jgi:hypothetical protein
LLLTLEIKIFNDSSKVKISKGSIAVAKLVESFFKPLLNPISSNIYILCPWPFITLLNNMNYTFSLSLMIINPEH